MTPIDPAEEIQSLKAQLNALAQFALRVAAVLEMSNLVDGTVLEAELRKTKWPEPMNDEARSAMAELCDQLADARNRRQELEQKS